MKNDFAGPNPNVSSILQWLHLCQFSRRRHCLTANLMAPHLVLHVQRLPLEQQLPKSAFSKTNAEQFPIVGEVM